MSAKETQKETIAFQAETRELLDLVIHSLYTHKEIFLRELISNASDALDRLRFEALRSEGGAGEALDRSGLRIRLEVDRENRLLEIDDNGIGMTRQEVIDSIGTIASSGTRGFLEALKAKGDTQSLPELIGQFGVGFYSAFMVADEVEVETKRAGEQGVRWSSKGAGEYTLEDIDKSDPGTTVVLHLGAIDGNVEGERDFTAEWVLREVVKKYSDFIEYPIQLETGEGEEAKLETLNSMKPLWTRSRSDIEEEEYVEFYKHLSHDWNEPLETIHFQAEGATEYSALLYLPKQRPLDLFDPSQAKSHVHLYVKRVFIMEDCEELMPVWLRFVRGVVDSADLPLNVSRETLQHNRQMGQIQKRLTRKVIDGMAALLKDRRSDYEGFWDAFGPVVKEGIYYDTELQEDVARLALFHGTHGSEEGDADSTRTTLAEYLERMPDEQEEIFVLLAESQQAALRSPHLETFQKRGLEVLFLTDPVDEFCLQRFTEFDGKQLRRIDRGELDLEDEGEKSEREAKEGVLEPVLAAVREELSERVEDVRFSSRLTDSPACLVTPENALTPQMRRMLQGQGQDVPAEKRVLELNAAHPLVERLKSLSEDDSETFGDACELLLGTALVTEGTPPEDPTRYAKLVTELMLR